MDLETDERDVDTSMSRRRLVTLTGAAGLSGLAAALLVDRSALALPEDDEVERPNVPTAADSALLSQVIGLELAASVLYRAKLEADGDDGQLEEPDAEETDAETNEPVPLSVAILVMAENHQAFAQAISGATGLGAAEPNDDIVETNRSGFTGSDDDFFAAAHALEQTAAATHTALIGQYESDDAIALTASIALTEVRHATVLADLLGLTDLDVLFGNDESALSLGGDA